jgi:1-deoxy-D-xylulose-5-phosphate reductoisomerase
MKKIVILGSTGSIGLNALKVVSDMPGYFEVLGLSANANTEILARQVREFKPRMVSLFEPRASEEFKMGLNGACQHLPPGVEGLVEMASHPDVDLVLTSLVGGVGFAPLLAAVRSGKNVALANKEPMVMAGAQFMREAQRWKARILPVDSEPSAIFQCLEGRTPRRPSSFKDMLRRVLLTASGGAFYARQGDLSEVTVEEALRHPTWKMGKKITIDCATLMNKGFEAIEIMNLFGLKHSQIEIIIHPQSIVHSAVEFSDGAILAQLSPPDMRLPIQYALTYPERTIRVIESLDLFDVGKLTFKKPDFKRFPCLELASEAARQGGGAGAVLNAADEVAVEAFIQGRIRFTDIPRVIERTLGAYSPSGGLPSFAEIVETDAWARSKAQEACGGVRL